MGFNAILKQMIDSNFEKYALLKKSWVTLTVYFVYFQSEFQVDNSYRLECLVKPPSSVDTTKRNSDVDLRQ